MSFAPFLSDFEHFGIYFQKMTIFARFFCAFFFEARHIFFEAIRASLGDVGHVGDPLGMLLSFWLESLVALIVPKSPIPTEQGRITRNAFGVGWSGIMRKMQKTNGKKMVKIAKN